MRPTIPLTMRPSVSLMMRPTLLLREPFQPTARLRSPLPKDDQSAHTITQRLRKAKSIPPELYPLAVVVLFALSAASYSIIRKFTTDKNLRLKRQGPAGRDQQHKKAESQH